VLLAKNLRVGDLDITGGTVRLAANGTSSGTSRVKSLAISSGAVLDLTNNNLIIDYSGSPGTLEDELRQHLSANRLVSSVAGTPAGTRLGYGDNVALGMTTFAGMSVDADSMLVKFTFAGDVNLDGQVTIADLGELATNWQSTAAVWRDGDFNYDGLVTIADLGDLASNWQAGVGNPLGMGFNDALAAVGLAGVVVPEPEAITVLAAGLVAAAARRRRSVAYP
jgi:hypothetical protein